MYLLFQSQNILDILGDVSSPTQPPAPSSGVNDLLDILGDVAAVSSGMFTCCLMLCFILYGAFI